MPTVYVTVPRDAAADLASTLVEERLAACVNRVDCRSTYRWEGEVTAEDSVHDPYAEWVRESPVRPGGPAGGGGATASESRPV